eukprot:gene4096-8144_t
MKAFLNVNEQPSPHMAQWNTLHRRAKVLEARLEAKVQKYSSLAQRINADFLCDEENPLMESKEEQELASDIDHDLNELSDCIVCMRENNASSTNPAHHQEVLIKRYQEIHFDYNAEFKNTSAAVHRKRESMELFQSSKKMHENQEDSSVAKLLRERNTIAASMKSINDVISQAFHTRDTLNSQRSTLTGSAGGLTGLAANIPTFNRLIDGVQRKKYRESLVVALFVGCILCFSIWWMFFR